jgi:hypothetical protein
MTESTFRLQYQEGPSLLRQRLTEPAPARIQIDGILEGSWGAWAEEVKTGPFGPAHIRGLLEFVRRFPQYAPLLVCDVEQVPTPERLAIPGISWQHLLLSGAPVHHVKRGTRFPRFV